jgi:PAS domain S-box-containing protein
LWEDTPEIAKVKWSNAKMFFPDGSLMKPEESPMALAVQKKKTIEQEILIEQPDGKRLYIRSYSKPVKDLEGRMIGSFNVLTDITHTKNAEDKSAMLAAIVHSSNDVIISKSPNGVITSWNESAQRMFGYSADEVIGKHISILIPTERLDEEPKILSRIRKGEIVDHFETQRMTKDNKLIDISLTISPIKDSKGIVIGASKIIRDISKQKNDEKLIRESELKFRLLADLMPQLIWAFDLNGNMNYANHALLKFSGMNQEELKKTGWLEFVHPDEKNEVTNRWKSSIEKGESFNFEHRLKDLNGKYLWHVTKIIPQKDSESKVQMWVGTSTDINERKIKTNELENVVNDRTKDLIKLNEDLKKSNKELAQFAYVASHDLQEPLRKIQTFANRIIQKDKDKLSENGIDYFERMQNAANRMQILIEDLLAYSRTNISDKIFESTDLNILLQDVRIGLETDVQEKNATIIIDPLPTLNIISFQFRQLFTNLISNSLKFSKANVPPVIHISSNYVKGSEIKNQNINPDQLYCVFKIADNGIGFSPEFSHRIFELFQRLHGKSEYSGTGIGLAICKKIAENHNGFIEAEAIPQAGATFYVYIPVNR